MGFEMLERTRKIWKRKFQAKLFDVAGIQDYLDEQNVHAAEDHMGFRGMLPEHRRFQITQLQKLGLQPSSTILEIGCGPLTAGIPVIAYLDPDRYVGVDVRPEVLNFSWQQVGKNGLAGKNPRLICSSDFANEELEDAKFDFVWSFSVLFHLSDDILDRLFQSISARLNKGGRFIANVQVTEDESTWLQFPFLKRPVETYAATAAKHGLACEDLGSLEEHGFKLDGADRLNRLLVFRALPTAPSR